jgi:NDP-sugar pyrophosphorylase family protein
MVEYKKEVIMKCVKDLKIKIIYITQENQTGTTYTRLQSKKQIKKQRSIFSIIN